MDKKLTCAEKQELDRQRMRRDAIRFWSIAGPILLLLILAFLWLVMRYAPQ